MAEVAAAGGGVEGTGEFGCRCATAGNSRASSILPLGLVGETIFAYRSQGSMVTGSDRPGGCDVNQRSVELNVAASVDPFAKGYAVIDASADPIYRRGRSLVSRGAIQTTSLPYNLELKAGRFFGEFGRLSYIPDHELPLVNRPLVLDQYIGGESKTDGAQLNCLLPIEHYVSLTMGVGNHFGHRTNTIPTITVTANTSPSAGWSILAEALPLLT